MHPKKPIKFSKMHGLGNDFAVVETITQENPFGKISIPNLAHRHKGIGFDQLLLITPSNVADFSCRIFNADGTEAEQCGNGMRCIARFIQEQKLSTKKTLSVEVKSGIVPITIHDFHRIEVNMGIPVLDNPQAIKVNHELLHLDVLSMGNPHAILQVTSFDHFSVSQLGYQISQHAAFPQGVNVGFMEVINKDHIRLRTFERGSGETLACGSNSCAAVVVGINNQLLDPTVKVELALGSLEVSWAGQDHPVMMSGPAEQVFDGVFYI